MDQYNVLTKNKLWKNCCEQCMCFWFYKCNNCKLSLKMISHDTYEINTFKPLMDRQYKDAKGEDRLPISFFNVFRRDCTIIECYGNPHIPNLVYSKKFHEILKSEKFVSFDSAHTEILVKDPNPSSINVMKDIIDSGLEVIIITGEGDFCLPYEGVMRAFNKIDFEFRKDFENLKFVRESDLVQTKSLKNLTWKKVDGCGHVPSDDQPDLDLEFTRSFVEKLI